MSIIKHCGFCSLLRELMRRAMCIASRRGSSESYYRELGDQDTLKIDGSQTSEDDSVEIHDDTNPGNGLPSTSNSRQYQRQQAQEPTEQNQVTEPNVPRVSVSEVDDGPAAPEALRTRETTRSRVTGRFHSMHKRRRRRLLTRALVDDEALLDDLLLGQVQCVLDHSASWDFNAFTLDNVAGGRGLPVLCVHLFQVYGLISHFRLDPVKVWKLFTLFEENYHCTNPYHNSIHAADVTQAMHCFLQQDQILEHMEPIDVMAGLLAAMAHDLDHPGVNQPFLVATSNHLVELYQNKSVLENHHWRAAISCLIESNMMDDMPEFQDQLQKKIRSLILATDITKQQDYLFQFKYYLHDKETLWYGGNSMQTFPNHFTEQNSRDVELLTCICLSKQLQLYLDTNTLDLTLEEHRHLVLQIALKCADISNPCRPWEISQSWSLKVCEEFFRQGDVERRLNLPLTPLCDRNTTTVPNIQSGFFKYVVTPLITEWHRFLHNELSEQMLKNLVTNHKRWDNYAKDKHEVTVVLKPPNEIEEEQDSANLSGSLELLLPRRSSLNPARPTSFRDQLRRFSAPLNVFQDGRPRNRERVPQDVASATETDENVSEGENEDRSPECVLSGEKLLPESSIASITTPIQAHRISHVFHDRNWKLVRQPTFPPLEGMSRAQSLIPRASSHDDCIYPRAVKSDSGIILEASLGENRQCRAGSQLQDNLTSVPLDLGRRRKSMPARAEAMTARERRFRELREVLPCLIARTLTPRPAGVGLYVRRGSAPATATEDSVQGTLLPAANSRAPRARHIPPTALPRRSSLPTQVMTGISSY